MSQKLHMNLGINKCSDLDQTPLKCHFGNFDVCILYFYDVVNFPITLVYRSNLRMSVAVQSDFLK